MSVRLEMRAFLVFLVGMIAGLTLIRLPLVESLLLGSLAACGYVVVSPHSRKRRFWEAFNEGGARRQMGDLQGARAAYQRAVEVMERQDRKGAFTGKALAELGRVCLELGREEEAISTLSRSAQRLESALGRDAIPVADVLLSLAEAYMANGQFSEVEAISRRILPRFEMDLPRSTDAMCRGVCVQIACFLELGHTSEADSLTSDVQRAWERADLPRDVRYARLMRTIADLFLAHGSFREAESPLSRALRAFESIFGPEHPDAIACRALLAHGYCKQGRMERAWELIDQTLRACEQGIQSVPEALFAAVIRYAEYLRDEGSTDNEAALLERLNALLERDAQAQPVHVAETKNCMARCAFTNKDFTKAETLMVKAIELAERQLGPCSPLLVQLFENYSHVLIEAGRHDDARRVLMRADVIRCCETN